MTNTKLFLLLGTSLSFLPQTLNAQCVSPIQDCYALGYTQTSCPNGKGVKCPFGSGWYCGGTAAQDCIKLGYDKDCTGAGDSGSGETCNGKYQSCTCDSSYKYNCSGTGYSGGSGTACGGKYTKCTCTSGYSWNGSSCTLSCASSYKYTCTGTGYSGGSGSACGGKYTKCTCSSPYTWTSGACSCPSTYQYICSGTGYSGGSGTACGGKYTACNCADGYEWKDGSCQKQVLNGAQGDLYYCNGTVVGVKASSMNFYIAMKDIGYMNWNSANRQCQNYSFCSNVKGKLPSYGDLTTIYNNKSQINTLLAIYGGSQLTESYSYWSSTQSVTNVYVRVSMRDGKNVGSSSDSSYNVRPVLASW